MDSIFIDTDIILDLIQKREPYYNDAIRLFSLVEEKQVVGYVSPLIFANLYYILRKTDSKLFAIQTLVRLKALVRVITLRNVSGGEISTIVEETQGIYKGIDSGAESRKLRTDCERNVHN